MINTIHSHITVLYRKYPVKNPEIQTHEMASTKHTAPLHTVSELQ